MVVCCFCSAARWQRVMISLFALLVSCALSASPLSGMKSSSDLPCGLWCSRWSAPWSGHDAGTLGRGPTLAASEEADADAMTLAPLQCHGSALVIAGGDGGDLGAAGSMVVNALCSVAPSLCTTALTAKAVDTMVSSVPECDGSRRAMKSSRCCSSDFLGALWCSSLQRLGCSFPIAGTYCLVGTLSCTTALMAKAAATMVSSISGCSRGRCASCCVSAWSPLSSLTLCLRGDGGVAVELALPVSNGLV